MQARTSYSAFFLALLAFVPAAQAQPAPAQPGKPVETIIVPGEKAAEEAAHDFVQKFSAPAPYLGKLARWNKRNPLCPAAGGFPPGYDRFMVSRIKEIAAMVGAPVSQKSSCKTNMAIIVTKDAQGLMNEIRRHRTDLLGYYQTGTQADRLTTMNFPVQVLYETATIDVNGHVVRDDGGGPSGEAIVTADNPNAGTEAPSDPTSPGPTAGGAYGLPGQGGTLAVTGMRARDGLESAFFNVTIVVDAAKVDEFNLQMGALADYLAMIALSQTENFTPCEQLPSITSLMTPDCATHGAAHAISATDIAYLKGVYRMDGGLNAPIQKGNVVHDMRNSLMGER